MSLPKYESYKDSGVEWLGEVPKHWEVKRVKNVANINMGQSPSSQDCNQDGNGTPFLQGNADFGETNPFPRHFCSVANKLSSTGDILFSVRAPVGAINISDQIYGIGRGLCAFTPNKFNFVKFFFFALEIVKSELFSVATGSTYEAVSVEQIANAIFIAPPIIEQNAIAQFLDQETAKIDNLIAEQQQLIKLLKEKRQAVISHAVTKGLNPNVPMKNSGVEWLGEVPEHWRNVKLKTYISTRKGAAFKAEFFCTEGVRVVKASDIKDFSIRESEVFLPLGFLDQYTNAILRHGDIVISTVGSTPDVKNSAVGQLAKIPKNIDGALLNQNTVVFSINEISKLDNNFLFLLLQTSRYRDHLDINAHGTANQASLNISDMLDFVITIPTLEEQKIIAQFIDQETTKIDNLSSEAIDVISLLKERRSALISSAVTGKIDVRNYVSTQPQIEAMT